MTWRPDPDALRGHIAVVAGATRALKGPPSETHLISSHALLPLLTARPGGLLVDITDGTTEYDVPHYRTSVFYDLVKRAVNRLVLESRTRTGDVCWVLDAAG